MDNFNITPKTKKLGSTETTDTSNKVFLHTTNEKSQYS